MTTQERIKEIENEIEEIKENMWGIELIRRRADNGKSWGYDWNGKRISIPKEYEDKEHYFERMNNVLIEVKILQAKLETLKSCSEEITRLKEEQTAKVGEFRKELERLKVLPRYYVILLDKYNKIFSQNKELKKAGDKK